MVDRFAELEVKRNMKMAGGGQSRAAKQKEAGKWTARERIATLLDVGTFVEIGLFVEPRSTAFDMDPSAVPGDGVVAGYGTVAGRAVYVYAQDFTVLGGSLGEMHARKICQVMDLALAAGAPVVGILDSGGARIQEGVDALHGFGEIFTRNVEASGVIPQISVVVGPCAGGAAYSPALTDFVFMVDEIAQMFVTGPQVIKSVTGEEVSMVDLGGSYAHSTKSGVAHFRYENEEMVYAGIRQLLSYLPSNNADEAPSATSLPVAQDFTSTLLPTDANRPYDVHEVIRALVDDGSFMECQADFALNVVTGFARIEGRAVAVIGNQPSVMAGCLDIDGSDKLARFVRFADAFNLPLLTLVDTPGYLPGVHQEHRGIIRHGAKILYAYAEATVPKISVILRKAYGGAYLAMCSRSLGADQVLALPGAEIAVMGPDGAVNILYRKELQEVEDVDRFRNQKINEYREMFASPYVAARRGYVDQVVQPNEVRALLSRMFWHLRHKRQSRPLRKHGNLPL